jgi:16S rRNA (guanine966-N2)-methyltransferase
MRIISGRQKGRRISAGKGSGIRPTSDRVRESIFNVLRGEVEGKRVLDLFAGAGGLGLEALSRGAEWVTFVDSSSRSTNLLKSNLERLSLRSCSTVIKLDGLKALKRLEESFDLIFADPPYGKGLIQRIVDSLAGSQTLREGGILVLEHDRREIFDCPEELSILKQRKFGDTVVCFLMKRKPG